MVLQIKLVSYPEAWEDIHQIRSIVYQKEQGVDPQLEFDGQDKVAKHFLAYLDCQAVGTTRIRNLDGKRAKIERLAVLKIARGQGIGTDLMTQALAFLTEEGYQEVVIHAQAYIKRLYEKMGFVQVGEGFIEAGIPHIKMTIGINHQTR